MAAIDVPSAQFAVQSKTVTFAEIVSVAITRKGFVVGLTPIALDAVVGVINHIELPYYTLNFTTSANVTSIVAGGGLSPTEGQIFPRGKEPTG